MLVLHIGFIKMTILLDVYHHFKQKETVLENVED